MKIRAIIAVGLASTLFLAAADPTASSASGLVITVIEGSGARNSIGSKTAAAPIVQVRDATGKPAANVTVTFELPEKGSQRIFSRPRKNTKADYQFTRPCRYVRLYSQ